MSTMSAISSVENGEAIGSVEGVLLHDLEEDNHKGNSNKVSFTDSTKKMQGLKLNDDVDYNDDDNDQPLQCRTSLCTGVLTASDDVALDQSEK